MNSNQLKSFLAFLIPVRFKLSYKMVLKITKGVPAYIVEDGFGVMHLTDSPEETDTVLYYLKWHSYGGKDVN